MWRVRRLLPVTYRRRTSSLLRVLDRGPHSGLVSRCRANSLLRVGRWLLELLLGVSRGLLLELLLLRGVFAAVLRLLDVLLDGLVGGGGWPAGDGAELVLLGYVGCGSIGATVADG